MADVPDATHADSAAPPLAPAFFRHHHAPEQVAHDAWLTTRQPPAPTAAATAAVDGLTAAAAVAAAAVTIGDSTAPDGAMSTSMSTAAFHEESREPVLEPGLPIVDPHHHLWDKHPSRAFVGRYMLEELSADMCGEGDNNGYGGDLVSNGGGAGVPSHNIVATCYMQSNSAGWVRAGGPPELQPVGEVEFAMGVAAMAESGRYCGHVRTCAGIIGTANLLLGEAVDPVLAASEAAARNYRGVRVHGGKAEDIPFDDPQFLAGLRVMERRGLVFDCNGPETHPLDFAGVLGGLCRVAQACPALTIVLDHCGGAIGPRCFDSAPERRAEWERGISALAACPNVFCKVGGLTMEINGFPIGKNDRGGRGPVSSLELLPLVAPLYRFVIEMFGPERCMFESNFPVDKWGVSYTVLWNTFKRLCGAEAMGLSEADKRHLFSGTAMRVYRLQLDDLLP